VADAVATAGADRVVLVDPHTTALEGHLPDPGRDPDRGARDHRPVLPHHRIDVLVEIPNESRSSARIRPVTSTTRSPRARTPPNASSTPGSGRPPSASVPSKSTAIARK
jgi:hypothetical protein